MSLEGKQDGALLKVRKVEIMDTKLPGMLNPLYDGSRERIFKIFLMF